MEIGKLKNKKVVVLGGTSGFGLATAKAAAQQGATVVISSRSKANIEKALKELPIGVEGVALDVSDETAVTNFFDGFGEFDHLVYTAGDSLPAELSSTAVARK